MNEEKPLVVQLKDKERVEDICQRAREKALMWLREQPSVPFWESEVSEGFAPFFLGRFLGYGRNDKIEFGSVARVLAHHSPMEFRSFKLGWEATGYPRMKVNIKDGFEWTDVFDEAWEGMERPAFGLSEPAGKLLKWAQTVKHQNEWIDKSTIGRQAAFRGTSWKAEFVLNLLKEIQEKTNIGLKYEEREDEFRIWFEPPKAIGPEPRPHGPLNPTPLTDFQKVEFAELNRFREELYDWILAAELPADGGELLIWRIHDRTTLFRCFPKWRENNWSASTLIQFLGQIGLEHGLLWGYSFQDPKPWTYCCGPKGDLTWGDVKEAIRNSRALPPPEERYGISKEAAALVKWFTTLRAKEWLGSLTPCIEDHMKLRIGISVQCRPENAAVYFAMLADEITDKTEWRVTVHPWKDGWGDPKHRLQVKGKPTEIEEVVTQIQLLGLRQGKVLSREEVQKTILILAGRCAREGY